MLSILGRSTIERAKSTMIGLLAGLLTLALWQIWIGRASTLGEEQDRQNAEGKRTFSGNLLLSKAVIPLKNKNIWRI